MSKEINMDIAVGDYVRTKSGEVFKVKEVNPTIGGKIAIVRKENGFIRRVDLEEEKHSKNIIDLIEEGDIVNNSYVYELGSADNGEKWVHTLNGLLLYEEDIKTILTKEQYLKNCYTVERS